MFLKNVVKYILFFWNLFINGCGIWDWCIYINFVKMFIYKKCSYFGIGFWCGFMWCSCSIKIVSMIDNDVIFIVIVR